MASSCWKCGKCLFYSTVAFLIIIEQILAIAIGSSLACLIATVTTTGLIPQTMALSVYGIWRSPHVRASLAVPLSLLACVVVALAPVCGCVGGLVWGARHAVSTCQDDHILIAVIDTCAWAGRHSVRHMRNLRRNTARCAQEWVPSARGPAGVSYPKCVLALLLGTPAAVLTFPLWIVVALSRRPSVSVSHASLAFHRTVFERENRAAEAGGGGGGGGGCCFCCSASCVAYIKAALALVASVLVLPFEIATVAVMVLLNAWAVAYAKGGAWSLFSSARMIARINHNFTRFVSDTEREIEEISSNKKSSTSTDVIQAGVGEGIGMASFHGEEGGPASIALSELSSSDGDLDVAPLPMI